MRTTKTIVVEVCQCDRVGCGAEIPADTVPEVVMGVSYDLCGTCRKLFALTVEGFMQSTEAPAEAQKVPAQDVAPSPAKEIATKVAETIAEEIGDEPPKTAVVDVDVSAMDPPEPEDAIRIALEGAPVPLTKRELYEAVQAQGLMLDMTTLGHMLNDLACRKVVRIGALRGRKAYSLTGAVA